MFQTYISAAAWVLGLIATPRGNQTLFSDNNLVTVKLLIARYKLEGGQSNCSHRRGVYTDSIGENKAAGTNTWKCPSSSKSMVWYLLVVSVYWSEVGSNDCVEVASRVDGSWVPDYGLSTGYGILIGAQCGQESVAGCKWKRPETLTAICFTLVGYFSIKELHSNMRQKGERKS